MKLILYARATTAKDIQVWVGATDCSSVPSPLSWEIDGNPTSSPTELSSSSRFARMNMQVHLENQEPTMDYLSSKI